LGRFRAGQVELSDVFPDSGGLLPPFGFVSLHLLVNADVSNGGGAHPGKYGIPISVVLVMVGVDHVPDRF
jgi:hypothetical protein